MKATRKENHAKKFTTSHRKENGNFIEEISALVPVTSHNGRQELKAVVTLRTYGTSTNGSNTACIWISGKDFYSNGSGHAGGYGYHRTSAAAGEAIENAGFNLSEDISGRGEIAIEEAVLAISAAVGYPEAMIHRAHA